MEPSLDTLITSAAPPVARRTPDLDRELTGLVAEAEASALGRSRRRGRIALGGLAVLGVVGLGSGASAAGLAPAPPWAPWYDAPAAEHTQTVSSGALCEVRYGLKAVRDPRHPVDPAERAAAVAAAGDFLRDFDFATIDLDRAVERVPATAVDPGAGPEEVEPFAVQLALQERLDAELTRLGLPTTVRVGAAQWCDGGDS